MLTNHYLSSAQFEPVYGWLEQLELVAEAEVAAQLQAAFRGSLQVLCVTHGAAVEASP